MAFLKSITNLTNLSLSITKHLFSKKEYHDKNILFSPLSLHVVLSIFAAKSEGPIQRHILSFLRSNSANHLNSFASHLVSNVLSDAAPFGGPRLSVANGVWAEQTVSLKPSFKQLLTAEYKATLALVDFLYKAEEVRDEVNLWAEKETNGLIKDVLPQGSVHSLTRLIIANALYFKGAWYAKFDALETEDCDFHLLNGNSVKVPFITSEKKQLISAFDGFKVLCLPYKQGEDKRRFSMYFFLPDAKDGLSALVEKVASESEFLERKLPYKKVEVGEFRIPRFKISFQLEISNVLNELGLGMGDSQNLGINGILQKSFIEVNEEGTEAAAVTALIEGCCLHTPTPVRMDFVADHPFLFLIKEDLSGAILFIGQVLNPLDG